MRPSRELNRNTTENIVYSSNIIANLYKASLCLLLVEIFDCPNRYWTSIISLRGALTHSSFVSEVKKGSAMAAKSLSGVGKQSSIKICNIRVSPPSTIPLCRHGGGGTRMWRLLKGMRLAEEIFNAFPLQLYYVNDVLLVLLVVIYAKGLRATLTRHRNHFEWSLDNSDFPYPCQWVPITWTIESTVPRSPFAVDTIFCSAFVRVSGKFNFIKLDEITCVQCGSNNDDRGRILALAVDSVTSFYLW